MAIEVKHRIETIPTVEAEKLMSQDAAVAKEDTCFAP